jgi:activator of HSP90 ATPase
MNPSIVKKIMRPRLGLAILAVYSMTMTNVRADDLKLKTPVEEPVGALRIHDPLAKEEPAVPISFELDLPAAPSRVYQVLTETKEFTACTGAKAEISPVVGGPFSVFEGHIIGRNLDMVPGVRLVQAWRVVDWPAGVYSIARFELQARGTGTHLVFTHTGFPSSLREHLAEGWQQHYWDTLKAYLK